MYFSKIKIYNIPERSLNITIGEKIKELRKQNNFTQEDLANKLNIFTSNYIKIGNKFKFT